jgi:hypothetical protein
MGRLVVHRCKAFIVEDSAVIAENLIATLEELAGVEVVGTAPDEQTPLDGWPRIEANTTWSSSTSS